jgi:hypothetical protein
LAPTALSLSTAARISGRLQQDSQALNIFWLVVAVVVVPHNGNSPLVVVVVVRLSQGHSPHFQGQPCLFL